MAATTNTDPSDPVDATAAPPRPLFEVTPEVVERLQDPRLVLAIVAIVAGGIALLLGWYGVSGTFDSGEQTSYLVSGGLGGLFLAGVGAALVSSSNMRQATRKIDELQRGLDELTTSVADLHQALAAATEDAAERAGAPAPRAARRPRKAAAGS